MKINWKKKLTSRKFWAAVVGFAVPLMVGLNMSENDIAQITAIITSGGTLIAYIIGEGIADAGSKGGEE